MSIKSEFVKEQLKNKHLISYILDDFGYAKGVAVAFNKTHIGWAMVSPEDFRFKKEKPHNVPVISYLLRNGIEWNDIVPGPLFQRLVNHGFIVRFPLFSREVGLTKAIHRALAKRTEVTTYEKPDQPTVILGDIIRDEDLYVTLELLSKRAKKYFKE